jgi:hypothetical protein
MRKYIYRGDKITGKRFKDQVCFAVLHENGKCIRGRNGNMLVIFGKQKAVVLARQLRRLY